MDIFVLLMQTIFIDLDALSVVKRVPIINSDCLKTNLLAELQIFMALSLITVRLNILTITLQLPSYVQKHGEFYQSPLKHLSGHKCPKCRRSTGEERISKFL